eukprot:5421156-Ditylum_brightwellii.AAC.1
MSAMEIPFKMIEKSGRFANMTLFANDAIKNSVLIGSGLTCFINKLKVFQFFLGLHEAPCLGNKQRLVASVENSDEMIDIFLVVKDGLLANECFYPSDKNLWDLLIIWLTGNEVPSDPAILDEESDATVPSY